MVALRRLGRRRAFALSTRPWRASSSALTSASLLDASFASWRSRSAACCSTAATALSNFASASARTDAICAPAFVDDVAASASIASSLALYAFSDRARSDTLRATAASLARSPCSWAFRAARSTSLIESASSVFVF